MLNKKRCWINEFSNCIFVLIPSLKSQLSLHVDVYKYKFYDPEMLNLISLRFKSSELKTMYILDAA